MKKSPPKSPDPKDRRATLWLSTNAATFVKDLLKDSELTRECRVSLEQVLWLANLPYDKLGIYVHSIYAAISGVTLAAAIPIDNLIKHKKEKPKPCRKWVDQDPAHGGGASCVRVKDHDGECSAWKGDDV